MKSFQCFVLVLGVAVSLAGAFPRGKSSAENLDEETVIVPLEAQKQANGGGPNTHIIIGGFGPPIDFGAPLVGGFGPQFGEVSPYIGVPHEAPFLAGIPQPAPSIFSGLNPLGSGGTGGFLGGLESGLALMRRQLSTLLNSVPGMGGPANGDGNTTSTTKVIDGHRITINETVYGNGYDGSVFKVRVVDVYPDKTAPTTTEADDAEGTTVRPHKTEVETMGKLDSSESFTENPNVDGVELSENNATEGVSKENSSDSGEKLSNDITEKNDETTIKDVHISEESADEEYTGTFASKKQSNSDRSIESLEETGPIRHYSQKYHDTSLESFDEHEIRVVPSPDEWKSQEEKSDYQYEDLLENDIQREPIDLSNDIAVNDMAAAAGITADPQSEIIDIFQENKFPEGIIEIDNNERKLRSLRVPPIK